MSMSPLPWPQIRHAATGRYGQEVFRHLDKVMLHAVGVADSKADKPRPKGGQIWSFFPDDEKAKSWAAKKHPEGYECVVFTSMVVK